MPECTTVSVAVLQLDVRLGQYQRNLDGAMGMLEDCAREGCRLACLPEAFATSLDLRNARQVAEPIPGPTSSLLCRKAAELGLCIIAGILEREGDSVYSAAILVERDGSLVGKYRRVHIYELEKPFIASGAWYSSVHQTSCGRIGLILGYDLNYPEACRRLFHDRVEIIVCPAQIPAAYAPAMTLLARARATENCCYLVLASSAGENGLAYFRYMGRSTVCRSPITPDFCANEYVPCDPVKAQAGEEEGLLTTWLDLGRLRREQSRNPHWHDRCPATCSME